MRKVFNISYISKELANNNYNINVNDIVSNKAFKKIKNKLKSKHRIDNMNLSLSNDKFNNMVQKFFPSKYESLANSEWRTVKFYFSDEDEKVHWVVIQEGAERHFKVKTEEIFSRTEEETKEIYINIKKKIDKFYGYWINNDDSWFITDMNKANDSWKIVADKNGNYGSFGDFQTLNDLYII